MTNVIQFPSQDHFLIAVATDEDTGEQTFLLDMVVGRDRTEVGEYPTMFALVAAIDAIMGTDRSGSAA